MAQADAPDHLVFLQRGQADGLLSFDGGAVVRVRQFGPGTMIGETGFLLGTPRTATVRAITPCEVQNLTRSALRQLETEQPGAALAGLSRHLADKN